MVGQVEEGAEKKGAGADKVNHLRQREPTCIHPHLLYGACIFWIEVNQKSKYDDSDKEVGKVKKVGKDEFRSRYLDLLCEPSTFNFFKRTLESFAQYHSLHKQDIVENRIVYLVRWPWRRYGKDGRHKTVCCFATVTPGLEVIVQN